MISVSMIMGVCNWCFGIEMRPVELIAWEKCAGCLELQTGLWDLGVISEALSL